MDCPALPLTANQKKDLLSIVNSRSRRKKREARSAEGLTVEIIVHLDGVQQTFTITYYVDPEFDKFDEEVKLFESRQQKLTIKVSMNYGEHILSFNNSPFKTCLSLH